MKILHVINSVHASGGGPIEGVKQFAAVNLKQGHTVEVACVDDPRTTEVSTFPLPIYALGPGLMKYGYTNRLVPWLRDNAHRYDIVVVNGIWQYHSFATWRALRGSSTRYALFTHGMLDPWFKKQYPLKHLKKMFYWPWAENRVIRDAGAVLFTCEEERVLARQSFWPYRCNEIVVNYGTIGPQQGSQAELDTFFEYYPKLRGKRIAMFLGRIHEKKGCDLLIEAFAKVLASNPDWHLLICGPDQVGLKSTLEGLAFNLKIADRITWNAMVTGPMKWGALRASEVFVLPSHQENFGIVVAEALACGTPVLLSDKVNIWQEIQADGAGLVDNDDLSGTCNNLNAWLSLTDLERAEMRIRARGCFETRFEMSSAAHTLIRTLTQVKDGVKQGGALQ